jgi:uncharacterized protein involved in exopolysaccharide biosynthesis
MAQQETDSMSEATPTKPDDHESNQDDDEISLLGLATVIAKHKKLIVGLPLVVAVITAIVTLLLPNVYTGTTKVLPPQQTQSSSAVLAQLGSLTGGAVGSGLKNPNDLYVGMLKSRTVADNLIQRFDLNKLYNQQYQSATRRRLQALTNIMAGRDGIITIEVDDEDPKRAAALANGYVEELFKLTKVLALTEASQRRLFFERQMEEAKNSLARVELSARQGLEKGGIAQVEGQGRVMLEMTARLRAQITVKEIENGVLRAFATAQNPEVVRNQQEIGVLKRELARIEGGSSDRSSTPPSTNTEGADNLRLLRELKYQEAIYELLAKQFEIAKIDEAKDSAIIQVMDKAIEPDRKSKPVRSRIVLLSTLAAGFLALVCIFVLEALAKAHSDPRNTERWQSFRQHIQLRAWWRNRRV